MNQSIKIGIILLSAFCTFCKKPEIRQLKFSKSFPIKGDTLEMEADSIVGLLVANNYLIASQFSGNHFLRVYDASNCKLLGQLARKGSGVNEFPTSLMVDQYERCGDNDCLWVHDLNKGELIKINITKSLKEKITVVDQKIPTPAESRFHTAFFLDSQKVIGRSTNSTPQMNRLQIYDPLDDEILKTISLFPEIKRSRTGLDFVLNKYNMLYVSHIGLKSDKTKIASAMASFDRIDIFNSDGDLEKSVFNGKEIPDTNLEYLEETGSKKLQIYYSGIFTSDNYIYALYYGQPFSEYINIPVPTEVRIFDWSGNPLCKIELDDYLFNFTIDEKNSFMYGVDYVNKRILKYNIKNVLNEL